MGQCPFLEPVTVSLSVNRNLAYGWFKEIPAVDVSCQLESIKVSQNDITFKRNNTCFSRYKLQLRKLNPHCLFERLITATLCFLFKYYSVNQIVNGYINHTVFNFSF